jgi:hypothetical protein
LSLLSFSTDTRQSNDLVGTPTGSIAGRPSDGSPQNRTTDPITPEAKKTKGITQIIGGHERKGLEDQAARMGRGVERNISPDKAQAPPVSPDIQLIPKKGGDDTARISSLTTKRGTPRSKQDVDCTGRSSVVNHEPLHLPTMTQNFLKKESCEEMEGLEGIVAQNSNLKRRDHTSIIVTPPGPAPNADPWSRITTSTPSTIRLVQ